MTGLDLESFLRVSRADLGAWLVLGLVALALALFVWSCRGSRRALRKCLVLSLFVHCGLVLYGSTIPSVRWLFGADSRDLARRVHIRQIRVTPLVAAPRFASLEPGGSAKPAALARTDAERINEPRWELAASPVGLANVALHIPRPRAPDFPQPLPTTEQAPRAPIPVDRAMPNRHGRAEDVSTPEPRADSSGAARGDAPPPSTPMPPNSVELDSSQPSRLRAAQEDQRRDHTKQSATVSDLGGIVLQSERRLRPQPAPRSDHDHTTNEVARPRADQRSPGDTAHGALATSVAQGAPRPGSADPAAGVGPPLELAHAMPKSRGRLGLAPLGDRSENRNVPDIPRIYQPRVEPNRSKRAQHSGASIASELAVERALDWLARHQDPDGRWDAGVARYEDGTAVNGDHDFTVHCPPGQTCFGACAYWEADTALTGLALLSYLGAGYTHKDGRYTEAVAKGLGFLLAQQKPDGDLRGPSRVVGMYCHAMATLSLCEAYALSGDERLRGPAARAVAFLVKSRARDGLAWRYSPGAPVGDTSILGWVVMALKSAKEIGIEIPNEQSLHDGTLTWLEKVAAGTAGGLARYQPWEPVTATMTAEAWVCRQFLGVGGPGATSSEAAEFLLQNDSDRGATNVYYWYYATLALYQQGGEAWNRWNAKMRDRIVGLQCSSGHQTGSWEPDSSPYGAKGGRIYCTTLAALSLEVYYRYLRLYDEPKLPLEAGPNPANGSGFTSPRGPSRARF
jgi:hypothetical protein